MPFEFRTGDRVRLRDPAGFVGVVVLSTAEEVLVAFPNGERVVLPAAGLDKLERIEPDTDPTERRPAPP